MYAHNEVSDAAEAIRESGPAISSNSSQLSSTSLAAALRRKGPTIVADGVTLTGGLTAGGVVEIHGKVCGDVCCAELEIGPKGCVEGNIVADEIIVSGTVTGGVYGRDVTLRRTANVDGTLSAQTLSMADGASCVDTPNCLCIDGAGTAGAATEPEIPDSAEVLPVIEDRPRHWIRTMAERLKTKRRQEPSPDLVARLSGTR